MIQGTYEREETATRSCGEDGVGYLTAPLTGVGFDNVWDAHKFIDRLINSVYGQGYVPVPSLEVNRRLGKRAQGRYSSSGEIEIAPHIRMRTLVHELAHHVAFYRHDDMNHSAQFKHIFRALLERTYMMLERPLPKKPSTQIEKPKVGADVIFEHRGKTILGTVVAVKQVCCHVKDETGNTWKCRISGLSWDR